MALVSTPSNAFQQRLNKENGPHQLETPSTASSTASRQRVVFSNRNQEHWFGPVLSVYRTPSSSQEPSKSILKKRTYEEFLADDLFPPDQLQRPSTPEPENPPEQPTYLLSPIKTIVQSVAPGSFDDVPEPTLLNLIEAYCVLNARIRAKLLPVPTLGEPKPASTETLVIPAIQPLRQYINQIAIAMTRDISRALEDPLKGSETPQEDLPSLPSPPPSSPMAFDSSPMALSTASDTPAKKSGMNEQQVKHARDLCTVAQSAMKFFSCLLSFTGLIHNGILFTEQQLSDLVGAVLSVPQGSPLPTPNSRKTCALAVGILANCSLPAAVLEPHATEIATVFKRGIDGELGREGKKGSASDATRGVLLLSLEHSGIFLFPFSILVPSLLRIISGPTNNMHSHSGFALGGLAWASIEAPSTPTAIRDAVTECLSLKPAKKKDGNQKDVQPPPVLVSVTRYFHHLLQTTTAKDSGDGKSEVGSAAANAAHTVAMWGLMVLSSLIVLSQGAFHNSKLLTGTITRIARILLASKRVAIRTAASWCWRSYLWSVMRQFDEMDVEQHDDKVELIQRVFEFLDKGVGTGLVCALLVGSAGREDRDLRIDLSLTALSEMTNRRANVDEVLHVLSRLLETEKYASPEGPALGWDLNKLLPMPLFDGQLADADPKQVLVLIKQQASLDENWAEEITPLRKEECDSRLSKLYEIWHGAVRSQGIDERGHPFENIQEAWKLLVKLLPTPPSETVLSFITEPTHTWTNIAEPTNSSSLIPHQVAQIRFLKCIWNGLAQHFGPIPEMKQLALDIYDQGLQVFQLEEKKIEEVCLELFFQLSEIENSIVSLITEHDEWSASLKHTFWTQSINLATDEDLLRTLCRVPFGEPQPFELSEDDWIFWEMTWQQYASIRGEDHADIWMLHQQFADELSSHLLPAEACKIVTAILRTLPTTPAPQDVDCHSFYTLLNQTLLLAYSCGSKECMHLAISILRVLTQTMPLLHENCLDALTPCLIHWIHDEEHHLSDSEYDLIVGSTFEAALNVLKRKAVSGETLAAHSELLASIEARSTEGGATRTVFQRFWDGQYAGVISMDDVPEALYPLLQITESVAETEAMEEEDAADNLMQSDDTPSQPSSSPGIPNVHAASPLRDPLAHVAPASEAPDALDDLPPEVAATIGLRRWTGSSDDLSASVFGNESVPSPFYRVSRPSRSIFFSPGTPGRSTIPNFNYVPSPAYLGHSPRKPTSLSCELSASLFGTESPASPNKKKRRMGDDDDDMTPSKRRRHAVDTDSESDSDDDKTPKRPWLDFDPSSDDEGPLRSMPFRPFSAHNLPMSPFKFGALSSAPPSPAKPVPTVKQLNECLAETTLESQPRYVESGQMEKGNPIAKRRRLESEDDVSTIELVPFSDDALHSDDVTSDSLPPSDSPVLNSDDLDPHAIVSPPMAEGEAGSDDSNDSPLKALADRKKRQNVSKVRSSPYSPRRLQPPTPVKHAQSEPFSGPEFQKAIKQAFSLFPSMDNKSLQHMSSLLDQMRSKVDTELERRRSEPC